MTFHDLIFRQCRFSTLRLKNCKLENCQITQSIIDEDSYLRHAVLKKVDFTCTIFRNCNLEKAQFIDCDLRFEEGTIGKKIIDFFISKCGGKRRKNMLQMLEEMKNYIETLELQ